MATGRLAARALWRRAGSAAPAPLPAPPVPAAVACRALSGDAAGPLTPPSTPPPRARLELYTWGRGESGALGHSSDLTERSPRRVGFWDSRADAEPITTIAAGLFHSAALGASGRLWIWGRGAGGRLGQGDEEWAFEPQPLQQARLRFSRVALGGLHSAGIAAPLPAAADAAAPADAPAPEGPPEPSEPGLYTWGFGGWGALGHGVYLRELEPRRVAGMDGKRPVAVVCGGAHTVALTASGEVWAWGRDEGEGRLGVQDAAALGADGGSAVPLRVPVPPAAALAAGGFHTLAVLAGAGDAPSGGGGGGVWAWGGNKNGELGRGSRTGGWKPGPVPALCAPGMRVVAVAAGGLHSLALTAEGQVLTWGAGKNGQLGHGEPHGELSPRPVEALAHTRIASVAAAGNTSYALAADGSLWGWGCNVDGQLGLGGSDRSDQALPVRVPLPGRAVALAAGSCHAMVLLEEEEGAAAGGAAGPEA